jgi:hypothetical protein
VVHQNPSTHTQALSDQLEGMLHQPQEANSLKQTNTDIVFFCQIQLLYGYFLNQYCLVSLPVKLFYSQRVQLPLFFKFNSKA